jgi:hypothetical protein
MSLLFKLLLLLKCNWYKEKASLQAIEASFKDVIEVSTMHAIAIRSFFFALKQPFTRICHHNYTTNMQPVHTAGLPGGPPDGAAPPSRALLPPTGNRPTLARIRTEGYAGYSIKYSPFFPGVIAIASSANFGLVGNGRLHTFNLGTGPLGVPDKR